MVAGRAGEENESRLFWMKHDDGDGNSTSASANIGGFVIIFIGHDLLCVFFSCSVYGTGFLLVAQRYLACLLSC